MDRVFNSLQSELTCYFVDASKLWLLKKSSDVHLTLRYQLLDLLDECFPVVLYISCCLNVALSLLSYVSIKFIV